MELSFGTVDGLQATKIEMDEAIKRLRPFLNRLEQSGISPMVFTVLALNELEDRGYSPHICDKALYTLNLFIARKESLSTEMAEQMLLAFDTVAKDEDELLLAFACAHLVNVFHEKVLSSAVMSVLSPTPICGN